MKNTINLDKLNAVELTAIYKELNPKCKAVVLKCGKTEIIKRITKFTSVDENGFMNSPKSCKSDLEIKKQVAEKKERTETVKKVTPSDGSDCNMIIVDQKPETLKPGKDERRILIHKGNEQSIPAGNYKMVSRPINKDQNRVRTIINEYIQDEAFQPLQNYHFSQLKRFQEWCSFFEVEPTRRQASKFRNRRGLLFNKMILNSNQVSR